MSVEFNKFKPGLRTNFNTDTGIKKNFAAKSAESTSTSATRSTTGNTAAANLANKTLTSTNWSSQTGSVFNIKNSTQAANSGAVVNRNSSSGNSSYGVLNSSAKIKSSNYVSSGYGNKKAQERELHKRQTTGQIEYANTREIGFTGGSKRAGLRAWSNEQDAMRYMMKQLDTSPRENFWTRLGKVFAAATGVIGVVAAGVGLVKDIVSPSSSKSSKATANTDIGSGSKPGSSVTQPSSTGTSPAASTRTSVTGMQNAQDENALGTAIDAAKDDKQKINGEIDKQKNNRAEAKGASKGLKAKAKRERKQADEARKEQEVHKKNAAKYEEQASRAKGAIEGLTANKDSCELTMNNNKTRINNIDNSEIPNIDSRISQLKSNNENGQNDAQIAQLEAQKAKLNAEKDKLTAENENLQSKVTDLNNQIDQQEQKKKDALDAAAEESDQADALDERVKQEEKEAREAEDASGKNDAAIEAADEQIEALKQQKVDLDTAIDEQEDRLKEMRKKKIKEGTS